MNWPKPKEIPDWLNKKAAEPLEAYNQGRTDCIRAYEEALEHEAYVSPHKLYEMAKGDIEKYKELMLAHGYIIPKAQRHGLVPLDRAKIIERWLIERKGISDFELSIIGYICDICGTPKAGVESHSCVVCGSEALILQAENGWRCSNHVLFGTTPERGKT